MSDFSITAALAPADLPDVMKLFRAYAESLPTDLAYQGFEEELAGLPGKYAQPAGALLIARTADGRAVGCVALRPIVGEGVCEMKRLYVVPDVRGTGLGRALVCAVIETARAMGYREMRLDTLPSMAAAQAMYARAGFREIEPYYRTPIDGTVFLGLTL
jgi:ribosomal protein S18 acetylase RimI-like enzyme